MAELVELPTGEYVVTLELLKKIDFLKDVEEDHLKNMLFSIQKQTFNPNKTILFQGEIANQLFIIRKGKVIITTKNKGTKLTLAELTPPQYFGEISLLTPSSATATVTSGDEGADLLVLTHEALNQLTKRLPDIKERIKKVIDMRIASKQQAKENDENR